MKDVFEKSISLINKFLEDHSTEEIQGMADQWGIRMVNGVTVEEYFEGFERSFDYSKILEKDAAEKLISHKWEFSTLVSVNFDLEISKVNSITFKIESEFISDCKRGHAA